MLKYHLVVSIIYLFGTMASESMAQRMSIRDFRMELQEYADREFAATKEVKICEQEISSTKSQIQRIESDIENIWTKIHTLTGTSYLTYNAYRKQMFARVKADAYPVTSSTQIVRQKDLPKNAVKKAQNILISLDYSPGIPDGLWGKKTANALKSFQSDNGLTKTGKLDKETFQRLKLQKDHTVIINLDKISECSFVRFRNLNNQLKLEGGGWRSLVKGKNIVLASGLVRGGVNDAAGIGTYLLISKGETTEICSLSVSEGAVAITKRGFEFRKGTKFEKK